MQKEELLVMSRTSSSTRWHRSSKEIGAPLLSTNLSHEQEGRLREALADTE